jgi:hypothetical protein
MAEIETIQLGEFCRLFKVRDREVRYVLEEGYVPDGVRRAPSTGNPREFKPDQAFWLAIVLKLKNVGLKTPLAARAADYATEGLRNVSQKLSWDWRFVPKKGWFDTDHQYYTDIGDLEFIRLVTDACPSSRKLYEFDWHPVEGKRIPVIVKPFVVLRVDLGRIAELLKQVDAWSCPDYTSGS